MVLDNGGARIPGTQGFIDVGRSAGGKPQPRTDVQEMHQWQHGQMDAQAGFISCRRGGVLEVQDALVSTPEL